MPYLILIYILQVKELKNVYTTRVNVQVTAAQQNLDVAQTSLAEIRQKVIFLYIILSSSKLSQYNLIHELLFINQILVFYIYQDFDFLSFFDFEIGQD